MHDEVVAAAVAGGVTRLVCPPDTDPVLDEPGLVEMLRHRAETLNLAQVHPLGALNAVLTLRTFKRAACYPSHGQAGQWPGEFSDLLPIRRGWPIAGAAQHRSHDAGWRQPVATGFRWIASQQLMGW